MKALFFFSSILYSPVLTMHNTIFVMHDDCFMGRLDEVQRFIDRGCDVNQKNNYGLTPLMMALQMYNHAIPAQTYYDIVTLLISVGAKPELAAHDGRTAVAFCMQNTGGTPTKIAIRENIKKLLEYHATIF
jgi:ankyrin repeat protein